MVLVKSAIFTGVIAASGTAQHILNVDSHDVERQSSNSNISTCRCYPGDTCWPSVNEWSAFNASIDGRLIATIPLASPCHDSQFATYNVDQCKQLQDEWLDPALHYNDSASVMAPFFANRSCDPFLPRDSRCIVGTYVQYSVNVSTREHVSRTIKFVSERNIRLVIRNTGHDYNGKSTGAGAVSLWMHHLKDISFKDWRSAAYSGPAIKMGAGVQGIEAYRAAYDRGLRVVGGECPTVGLAGGYTQGGGHSALASRYGLAADQALEWEVIDGTGQYLKASHDENPDLYWALSGGGGGTYAVVLSLTSKAHMDGPVSAFNLTFDSRGIPQSTFWNAITTWHTTLLSLTQLGTMAITTFTNTSFQVWPLTAPDMPQTQLGNLLQPYLTYLTSLNVSYKSYFAEFPSYLSQFTNMQQPIPVGVSQYGGRLIPRSLVADAVGNGKLTEAYRYIANLGGGVTTVALNVNPQNLNITPFNAILPAWRDAVLDTVLTTPWNFTAPLSEMLANQRLMTDNFIPTLEAVSPGSGAYMNEGDFLQPGWQDVFYGVNYGRLLDVKHKYDPNEVFYANRAVGSEVWTERTDGRLCRT